MFVTAYQVQFYDLPLNISSSIHLTIYCDISKVMKEIKMIIEINKKKRKKEGKMEGEEGKVEQKKMRRSTRTC